MDVDPSKSLSGQAAFQDEGEHVVMISDRCGRKRAQETRFLAGEPAEREFPEDKGMDEHAIVVQEIAETSHGRSACQILPPD